MKKLLLLLTSLFFIPLLAQNNEQWNGYFSYNSIKDIAYSNNKIYVAAENSYFAKDLQTNEIKKTSTIEGLSGDYITRIHHSSQFNKTIIGHVNGLVIVVNEVDGSMFYLMGIIDKLTIPSEKKKINHFEEYNGKLYISTDYGITVLDLTTSQFGDSYFIGPSGSNIEVFQTAVFNDNIYAITNGYGVLSSKVNNPFLVDYNQWSMIQTGNWSLIESTLDKLIAVNTSGNLYTISSSNVFNNVANLPQAAKSVKYNNGNLVFAGDNYISVYNDFLTEIFQTTNSSTPELIYTTAIVANNKLYYGTSEYGIKQSDLMSQTFTDITPNGPERNKMFRIKKSKSALWTVYGGYTSQYNPYNYCCGGPSRFGTSKYTNDNGWSTIAYKDLLDARALSNVAVNPVDENQVYIASFFSGLLKLKADKSETIFNSSNSILDDDLIPNVTLINSLQFDGNGNLWMTNSRVNKALNVLKKNGDWISYSFQNITNNPSADSYSSLLVDKNGTKWIGSYRNGLIAFSDNTNKFILVKSGADLGNLPNDDVRSIAIDNNNQLWIGTSLGLRIIQNVDKFLTENKLTTNSIIILEDDLAQELFYRFNILDIAVDGSNYKWVSAENAGVYLVSSNGQKTIHHFTKDNSPLPSDTVLDIDIDESSGEVFFATDKGLVSFKGVSTKGTNDYSSVYIYPNPLRPEQNQNVKVTGLMDKSNVKITDIEGNLVYEVISQGGTIEWDTLSFNNKKVSSGVYLVHISSEDGIETAIKKLLIVR